MEWNDQEQMQEAEESLSSKETQANLTGEQLDIMSENGKHPVR